jgi:ankyrin repeat protein
MVTKKKIKAASLILMLPFLLPACGDDQVKRLERQDEFVYAAHEGNLKKMKELYAEGVDINAPAGFQGHLTAPSLTLAAGGGHLEAVKFLLENGANVNVRDGHWTEHH